MSKRHPMALLNNRRAMTGIQPFTKPTGLADVTGMLVKTIKGMDMKDRRYRKASDGTEYVETPEGWRKVKDVSKK